MTRSEAAKICQSIKFILDKEDYSEEVEEALNMAIEALEHEPTVEYSSDVISRQAVLNLAKEGKLLSGNIYKKASDYINELPSADRPTGHWIETAQEYYEMINEKGGGVDENTPYFTDDIACSECLAKFSVIDNETERFDFCPNCGSYNGGGEE